MWSAILLLFTYVVYCVTPSVGDAALITMVPLKTGGNVGWFARQHQGSENPERNQFKNWTNWLNYNFVQLF